MLLVVKLNPQPWLRRWDKVMGFLAGFEIDESHFPTPGKVRKHMR